MRLSRSEVKYLRSLSQKKVREAEGKFILEGWKPILEAIDAGAAIELCAVVPSAVLTEGHRGLLERIQQKGIRRSDLTALELQQISGTVQAQGIIALVKQSRATLDELLRSAPPVVVACDMVNDPGNLGSIVRSCDWFGVTHLLLSDGCVSLYNEKVVRATTGSVFHLSVVEESDLAKDLQRLRSAGYVIVAAAGDGADAPALLPTLEKVVLVLGSEAHGIRPDIRALADRTVAIPKFGRAESLNVGVACGVLLAVRTMSQRNA